MDDPAFSQAPAARPHSTTHGRLQPLSFAPDHHTRFREAEDSHGLSALNGPGAGSASSTPVFHPPDFFNGFPSSYPGPLPGSAATEPHAFSAIGPLPAAEPRRNQQQQSSRRLPRQRQAYASRISSPSTASTDNALPPLSQFSTLPPSKVRVRALAEEPRSGSADLATTGSAHGSGSLEPTRGGQPPVDIVEKPPKLDLWRQKLFDLEEPVILTNEEYDTYFPWVDNVYSHRASQLPSKRKGLVTRYFDCRLKGRPSGTAKSEDPNKKKRKRTARPRDLCDVKIKITEYPAGSAADLVTARDAIGLDSKLVAEAVERMRDRPFRVIQRNGTTGDSDGGLATHKHDLQKSDEIKKSTPLRQLAEREKEAKRNQKPSPWKPRGNAAATAKDHGKDASIKFYSACFCPFSQRVWIALEAKGLEYQYCETYPLRKPKPTPLLEANPRGLVPAIWQEGWACAESSVILEYLEDFDSTVPLYPTVPKLKANCRLWIDFINTRIVHSFSNVLAATDDKSRGQGMEGLHRHISELVQAADETGPYFLGARMCLVDVHLAPFALRLSRLAPFRDLAPPTPPARWKPWLDALEQNPHVRGTMSVDALYSQSMDDLLRGLQGMSD